VAGSGGKRERRLPIVVASIAAPAAKRVATASSRPFIAANNNAVLPSIIDASTAAPAVNSVATTSSSPFSDASINTVFPL